MNKKDVNYLAISITCGEWNVEAIEHRIRYAIDANNLDVKAVAKSIHEKLQSFHEPQIKQVEKALLDTPIFIKWLNNKDQLRFVRINLLSPMMLDDPKPYINGKLPQLATYQELSSWLNMRQADLTWFADIKNLQAKTKDLKLQHYHYKWLSYPNKPPRLLETPKAYIKSIQRQILCEILNKIIPHEAAHGFRQGRSCLTHAQKHIQKKILMRMDIQDFFLSIMQRRIHNLFSSLGYPKNVSAILCALCTNSPNPIFLGKNYDALSWKKKKLITQPHLPQGAPTSPALANLCCWKLDKRLEGLAKKSEITYSRYADDLAFSGDINLYKGNLYLRKVIEQIVNEEGFLINHSKTFTKTRSQQQCLTGIVVNEHPNISRKEYDKIKAILYNCQRYGANSQNRNQHHNFQDFLKGKIAYINSINPSRAQKLQNMYEKIQW